ncbi:hypothetical protein Gpo141_00012344 [Globisporangium polare]
MTTVAEVRADTNRFRDEIHALVLRNTKLQREIMTLNTGRERAAAQGAQLTQELTDELNALDEELRHVRAQCHSMRRALDSQRSDADRLGEHMSSETSMSSTRFRRMSSAILGPSGGSGKLAQESPAPVGERSRGLSIATSALKRRDSVMSRFKSLSSKKMASGGSTPRVPSGDSSSEDEVEVDIDDARSVNIDEVSPMPSPGLLSVGSNKSLSSSTSSTSSSNGSGGRPPLRHQSSSNVLHYKASDEKKSTADTHKEHLNNFRRSSRLSRKMDST